MNKTKCISCNVDFIWLSTWINQPKNKCFNCWFKEKIASEERQISNSVKEEQK